MIKHDYKPQNTQKFSGQWSHLSFPQWLTHPYLIVGMAISTLSLAIILSLPEANLEQSPQTEEAATMNIEELSEIVHQQKLYGDPIDIPLELKREVKSTAPLSLTNDDSDWQMESVAKGDNLSKIFKRIGLSPQQLYEVVNLDKNTEVLKNLKPGEVISYQIDQDKNLSALKYAKNINQTLFVEKQQDQLISRLETKIIEYRTNYAQGTITDSLFVAGKKSGLTDTQVINLANIFDWDIDFHLDIRSGDSFSLLFEEKYLEGEKIGNGDIIAAEFINQGNSYTAVRYTDSAQNAAYYTPEGLSMQKAFLRAPLKFSYISSNFKPKRFHPILKRWKAHRGIDYRANTGTPIRAAGAGKVIASSYSKYNGKYVFIQHGQGIVTKYLHMSRRAVSNGSRVKQGQVIGYVGMTGLAEAPHLHYEFVVNGVHRNPRTVELPKANPIAKTEKNRFIAETAPWLVQLASRNSIASGSVNAAK